MAILCLTLITTVAAIGSLLSTEIHDQYISVHYWFVVFGVTLPVHEWTSTWNRYITRPSDNRQSSH